MVSGETEGTVKSQQSLKIWGLCPYCHCLLGLEVSKSTFVGGVLSF